MALLKPSTIRQTWPRGYKTWEQFQTQSKVQWLAACGHVSESIQWLRFILSLRMNSSFITSRPLYKALLSHVTLVYYTLNWFCLDKYIFQHKLQSSKYSKEHCVNVWPKYKCTQSLTHSKSWINKAWQKHFCPVISLVTYQGWWLLIKMK